MRGRGDILNEAPAPQEQERCRIEEPVKVRCKEQRVASASGATTGASESLQERRHGPRRIDLDHAVEVADVDAELKRRGGDDDGVLGFGEGLFRASPFVYRQRGVGDVGLDVSFAE